MRILWRRSLVGYSGRFIPGRSLVRIWPSPPTANRRLSDYINWIRPLGQAVKTSPFHGGIMGSNPVGVTNKRRVRSWNSGTDAFFLCSLMLFIRPYRPPPPRALHHFTPDRSGVYPYRPDFSHIRKVGVLHILLQYIIFSPKQNRGIGENMEKLPIFARPLTSSTSPISRFFAKNAT